jgi:hypothetical protein
VFDSNEWARQLASRPGVQVASSTAEAINLVEDIVTADDEMGRMLVAAWEADRAQPCRPQVLRKPSYAPHMRWVMG